MEIELIFDSDCPHVEKTRLRLRKALLGMGYEARWKEWERRAANQPGYVREFGSPTILINGKDIAFEVPAGEISCCRLYLDQNGKLEGVPSIESIRQALTESLD